MKTRSRKTRGVVYSEEIGWWVGLGELARKALGYLILGGLALAPLVSIALLTGSWWVALGLYAVGLVLVGLIWLGLRLIE